MNTEQTSKNIFTYTEIILKKLYLNSFVRVFNFLNIIQEKRFIIISHSDSLEEIKEIK